MEDSGINLLLKVAIPFAVFLGGLALGKPMVCRKVAYYIGSIAIALGGYALGGVVAGTMIRKAIIKSASGTYAVDFAITDGTASLAEMQNSGVELVGRIANAGDSVITTYMWTLIACCVTALICGASIQLAKMVAEDAEKRETSRNETRD